MRKDQVYAVVDLETTGTNPKDDRIIQIGCVFVKNNKIIQRYAADIRPGKTISKQIEHLTGLTNERLEQAPSFEDVAAEISDLLKNCVFVAHNIHFDYQFLSAELTRCGQSKLTIKGIDTVELAQIFLPQSSSFRLSDLSEEYNFSHDRPHQADSDAEVTASLLMMIEEKIMGLPLVTLDKISSLASQCSMDTPEYIEMLTTEMVRQLPPLPDQIVVVDKLAIRKKVAPNLDWYLPSQETFPESKKEKIKIYKDVLEYRPGQSKMMNFANRFFTTEISEETELTDRFAGKNLAIESSTGSGKTLGYLFPLSYLATPEKPVVISTVSVFLENQIFDKDIPKINQLRPGSLHATLLKSHQHYIDLARLANTLKKVPEQKQYALYQMKVLVWLTETETGDLTELQLTNMNHVFFQEVRHRGLNYLSPKSVFYEVDFWRHLQKKVAHSNVIIVNHHFLCQENRRESSLLPNTDFLIVDEAHHLPETAQQAASNQLNSYEVTKVLTQLISDIDQNGSLTDMCELGGWQQEYQLINQIVLSLIDTISEYKEDVLENLEIDHGYQLGAELMITNELLMESPIYTQRHGQQICQLFAELATVKNKLAAVYLAQLSRWRTSEQELMNKYLELLENCIADGQLMEKLLDPQAHSCVRWLQVTGHNQQITAYYSDFNKGTVLESKWYQKFHKILYTGGTIRVGKDTQFLGRELGLSYLPFKSVPSSYDYSQQGRLYVPLETHDFHELSSQPYVNFTSETLKELSVSVQRPILVLFTSHQMLQDVYRNIHHDLLTQGVEVLGQGISGSREKIVKRFEHNSNSILLGTDSFWEGLDLPGNALELIVVSRLPFDSPDRPFIKEKYQYLQSKGIDSFYKYALPKAALRLRQGLGRLIRSERDKGAMIVLDRRLTQANYGEMLQKTLPQDLPLKELTLVDTIKDIEEFLQNPS